MVRSLTIFILIFQTATGFAQTPGLAPSPQETPTAVPIGPDGRPTPTRQFGCKREFTILGANYRLDSFHKQDGEGLRPYLRDIPEANDLISQYQKNRNGIKTSAYVGTLGVFLLIFGPIIASLLFPVGPTTPQNQVTVDNISLLSRVGGLGLAIGAGIYSIGILRTNEEKIDQAINLHNQKYPERRIELVVETKVLF